MSRSGVYRDHYEALGIKIVSDPSEVTEKDVNDAYKRTARKHHPDKNKGVSSAKFISATQAVELLRDPIKREKFDEEYRARKREERRRLAEDERTKRMRIDLERRERENELQTRTTSELDRLRRQNESLSQMTKAARPVSSHVKTFTLDQHLAFEKDVLERALKYPA